MIIIYRILYKLGIIFKDFAFLLLINNTSTIAVSESEKVIKNARHINIYYHHIRDLIKKKTIKILHILTSRMAADDLIKVLIFNKFKKFIELVGVLKIKASNSKNNKASNSKANNSKNDSNSNNNSDKNNKIFKNSTNKEIEINKDYYEKKAE